MRNRSSIRTLVVATAAAATLALGACGQGNGSGSDAPSGDESTSAADVEAARAELGKYRFQTDAGEDASLADFAGTPLVLNFFASWCGPCRAEMPDLERISQATGDDVVVHGLLVNDSVEAGRAMVAETGVTYGWGLDTEDVLIDFDGIGMPTTVFIAADGEVLESHVGPLSLDQLRERVAEHFGVEVA